MTDHQEVKAALLQAVYEPGGATCPTCTQHAQVYRRTINSGMARSLIQLYRLDRQEPEAFWHVPTVLDARSREEGKLAYWGLLQEEAVSRPDGGRAGYWRITKRGRLFVAGVIRLPKHALVYDGRVIGMDESEMVSIKDALGKRFSYDDLMAGR